VVEGGLQVAGDASYGPLVDGEREEGSDFNDYLGITWSYPERNDLPEERQAQCLDCSGFIRMVFGFRRHLPGRLCEHDSALSQAARSRRVEEHEVANVVDLFTIVWVGSIREFAEELAENELAHVRFYRKTLGAQAVSRPAIDFEAGFGAAAKGAGLPEFDPFANDMNFLLGGMLFEDVGVTAYAGAASPDVSRRRRPTAPIERPRRDRRRSRGRSLSLPTRSSHFGSSSQP
jgi:hypothetical protein